jgi:membrane protease YdiL (CAAX protease family)
MSGKRQLSVWTAFGLWAGIFYGRVWRKTNSIFPAATVHGLVDTIWHLTFRTL